MQTREKFSVCEKDLIWENYIVLENVTGIISLNILLIIFIVTVVKPRFGFKELFEEFPKSSHLRDELLMLLGFFSFKGFPVKNIVSKCADVMNVFLLYC